MEPLITIETVPIKIEFVEKDPLTLSSIHAVNMNVTTNNNQQQIKSEPIRIDMQDAYVPSSIYNWENSTYTATAKIEDDGNLRINIQMEDGQSRAIRFRQTSRGIDSMAKLATSRIHNDGYEVADMQISFNMNQIPSALPAVNNMNTQFFPPDLELVVTQRPDVIITYIGGPIYVPPSSDPNYVPDPNSKPVFDFEGFSTIGDGSKLDQKV